MQELEVNEEKTNRTPYHRDRSNSATSSLCRCYCRTHCRFLCRLRCRCRCSNYEAWWSKYLSITSHGKKKVKPLDNFCRATGSKCLNCRHVEFSLVPYGAERMYHAVVVWNFVWIQALGKCQSERPRPHPAAGATAKLFHPYNQTGPMYVPAIPFKFVNIGRFDS